MCVCGGGCRRSSGAIAVAVVVRSPCLCVMNQNTGLPVGQPLREFLSRAPWLQAFEMCRAKDIINLAGNAQCLPLFGSMLILSLFVVERNDEHPSAAAASGSASLE